MSNSKLAKLVMLSPNHSGKRTHTIDRITPHCVVGQATAKRIGEIFAPVKRKGSCNYGIGYDGSIVLIVDEYNRSWCSSSEANDQRAITIECASDSQDPFAMTDAVYNSLINLCTDICRRNGKSKLIWIDSKKKALAYEPQQDEMLLTVHKWFANKLCPGKWLLSRLPELAERVTDKLSHVCPYKVKVSDNTTIFNALGNAINVCNAGVYTVVLETVIGSHLMGQLKSGAGYILLDNVQML